MLRDLLRRALCGLAVLLVLAWAGAAAGDPAPAPDPAHVLHLHTGSHVVTLGGSTLDLPPGWFLPEPRWDALDAETKRLQDAETRLTAENKSLRSAAGAWSPGWRTLIIAVGVGVIGAVGVIYR